MVTVAMAYIGEGEDVFCKLSRRAYGEVTSYLGGNMVNKWKEGAIAFPSAVTVAVSPDLLTPVRPPPQLTSLFFGNGTWMTYTARSKVNL